MAIALPDLDLPSSGCTLVIIRTVASFSSGDSLIMIVCKWEKKSSN